MIKFTIEGEAVAQARPRFNRHTGRAYDTQKSKSWKERVYFSALPHKPKELLTGPVYLHVNIHRSIPKSWSKKKRAAATNLEVLPTSKPDLSNILKGIEDALNGVIWRDDSQVVGLKMSKAYTDKPPFIEITIWGSASGAQE